MAEFDDLFSIRLQCEEMNSELDLRLHLHKPRARRAEYDVHNVRAGKFYYTTLLKDLDS